MLYLTAAIAMTLSDRQVIHDFSHWIVVIHLRFQLI